MSETGPAGEHRRPSRTGEAQAFERQFPGASASANAAVRALVQAYDDATRFANTALRHHQLSPSGRQALATIDGAGGSLSQSEIAERLLTTPASITSLIDTLERRGLVARARDVEDRRRQLVKITDSGAAVVHQFVPEAVALQTALMAEFSEREREQLIGMLRRISTAASLLDADTIVGPMRLSLQLPSPRRGKVARRLRPK